MSRGFPFLHHEWAGGERCEQQGGEAGAKVGHEG